MSAGAENRSAANGPPVLGRQSSVLAKVDFRIKLWLLIVSLATIALLAAAALRENVFSDWRRLRGQYAELLEAKATDPLGEAAARQFEVRIAQNYIPELGAVDRCPTCHAGLQDPRMVGQPQPFTTHPGRYVQIHDPEEFGCTVCHQGQGRATEIGAAHGRVPNWDHPVLETDLTVTTCTKCHVEADLYGARGLLVRARANGQVAGAPVLSAGRELMREEGCLGCHARGGKGGTTGPDLTLVGTKTRHDFDFSLVHGPRRVASWLEEHFLHPAAVSPGTLMPPVEGVQDARALTAYMLSMRAREVGKYSYEEPAEEGAEKPESGRDLYARYCSACHGMDGQGGMVPAISTPTLNNADVLAVASDDYYRFTIAGGRSNSQMPAWGPGAGGLTRDEIDRIVAYIRSWQPPGPDLADASSRSGDARQGQAYYRGLCAGCHGAAGEGGIGNSLNTAAFLAVADDYFLAESIVNGRPGTAMPAWRNLSAQALNDILAHIRTWQAQPSSFDEVVASMHSVDVVENARIGSILFRSDCASCHGRDGEGGIGPSLTSPDFLGAVSDFYLYRAITEGRPSTAMPAWRDLPADDVGALIAHLRSFEPSAAYQRSFHPGAAPGRGFQPRTTYRRIFETGEAPEPGAAALVGYVKSFGPGATDPQGLERAEAPRAGAAIPPGDYAVGEIYYNVSCRACHGEQAIGGVGPQLANPVFLSSVSDATLFSWIGRGRAGSAMKGFLPEEQGPTQLTAGQIADVIAYLRHLGTRDSLPILRTGVGRPGVGRDIFTGTCASCHGDNGEGASGPQLNNPAFLRTASDGFLAATIVLGRPGTAMLPMVRGRQGLGQIAPENVADVVALMRMWGFPTTWRETRRITEMSSRAISSGARKYSLYCSGCHGPSGRGVQDGPEYYAPALNNPEFLEAASDGFLLATIARGRGGTPMRPFGQGADGIVSLTSDEISDIVSFVRSWQRQESSTAGGYEE